MAVVLDSNKNGIRLYYMDEDCEKDLLPNNTNNIPKDGGFVETGSMAISVEGGVYMFGRKSNEWKKK